MIFQCPICNSIQESENSFQIKFFKANYKTIHRSECLVYQNFLSLISEKININKDVLDLLYLTEGLNKVLNIKDTYHILNDYSIKIIPENVELENDYEKEMHYIFANFLKINSNYNMSIKDNGNNNVIYLSNKDILLYLTKTYDPQILCFIEFNNDDCIPYDINLLNNNEKIDLKKNFSSYISECKTIEGKKYLAKKININHEEDLNIIYQKIEKQIKYFYSELNNIKMQLFEDNKKYFERSLLELELKEF